MDPQFSLSLEEMRSWLCLSAAQQPSWGDEWLVGEVRKDLARLPGLVTGAEIDVLRSLLAEAAAGRMRVIQAGDCAEDPAECAPEHVTRKLGLLQAIAGVMRMGSGLPVVRAGRIAGQFAKPRSASSEWVGGVELPVYRGHLVNGPDATVQSRCPDPLRLTLCYEAAARAMAFLRSAEDRVWTSHEALLLDYELPLLRRDVDGRLLLASTHWPWIGDRTRQLDGAHVRLLSVVANPVACKVGPGMDEDELLGLCERLDPCREPGRLTLIVRMGTTRVAERLPRLASRVRDEGHPVIWLCDPLHANTVQAPDGRKTRMLEAVIREVCAFQEALGEAQAVPGGLHLEATADPVTECVSAECPIDRVGERYTTLCDPRLNPQQALATAAAWTS
ncbi:3-deoxy-7-phosphoheptulonate synthase [Streptomyces humicola]